MAFIRGTWQNLAVGKLKWALAAALFWAGCVGEHGSGGQEGTNGSSSPEAETVALAPMHRLNHTEYRNTIRDLLGSALDPAADFPADDVSFGFDNIAAVLSMSPLQFELYETAAEQ